MDTTTTVTLGHGKAVHYGEPGSTITACGRRSQGRGRTMGQQGRCTRSGDEVTCKTCIKMTTVSTAAQTAADDVTRTELNTYTVYLTAAQGGRNKHAFRGIQATTPQEAIVAAYRARHGDHVTATTRDVHARGNDVTDRHFTIYGTAGAVTFVDVELEAEQGGQSEFDPNSLPANEAAFSFVRRTGSDYVAASAWLPTERGHCDKCEAWEAHMHPMKRRITFAELDAAVAEYLEEGYLRSIDT